MAKVEFVCCCLQCIYKTTSVEGERCSGYLKSVKKAAASRCFRLSSCLYKPTYYKRLQQFAAAYGSYFVYSDAVVPPLGTLALRLWCKVVCVEQCLLSGVEW
jgi:hypothetical protein